MSGLHFERVAFIGIGHIGSSLARVILRDKLAGSIIAAARRHETRDTVMRLKLANAVTADPAEGESLSEPATDLVEQVPMPEAIQQLVAAFIAEHHVERTFTKRKRDRADPEALGRRTPHRDEEPQ